MSGVHCWADYRDSLPFGSDAWVESFNTGNATCMLEDGHHGPHEWTPDEEIGVRFMPADPISKGSGE